MLQPRITAPLNENDRVNIFDCAASRDVWSPRGIRTTTMIDTVTALFGVLSASILVAHAYDGFRARF
jgi:hypothetical protein